MQGALKLLDRFEKWETWFERAELRKDWLFDYDTRRSLDPDGNIQLLRLELAERDHHNLPMGFDRKNNIARALDRVYAVGSQTTKRLLEVYPLHVLLQAGVTAYYDFGTSTPSGSNEQPRPFGIIVALELSHPDGYTLLIDPMKSATDHLPVFSYLPNKVRDTIDDRIVSTSRAA